MKKFTEWLKSLFTKEFMITVYRTGDSTHVYKSEYTAIKLFVTKPNHLKFRDTDGKMIEIRSAAGLDYKIEEL
jgi:hypothetical protein